MLTRTNVLLLLCLSIGGCHVGWGWSCPEPTPPIIETRWIDRPVQTAAETADAATGIETLGQAAEEAIRRQADAGEITAEQAAELVGGLRRLWGSLLNRVGCRPGPALVQPADQTALADRISAGTAAYVGRVAEHNDCMVAEGGPPLPVQTPVGGFTATIRDRLPPVAAKWYAWLFGQDMGVRVTAIAGGLGLGLLALGAWKKWTAAAAGGAMLLCLGGGVGILLMLLPAVQAALDHVAWALVGGLVLFLGILVLIQHNRCQELVAGTQRLLDREREDDLAAGMAAELVEQRNEARKELLRSAQGADTQRAVRAQKSEIRELGGQAA